MNFVFISPNFPNTYAHFIRSLKDNGVHVFGIGDEPYEKLSWELKCNLDEYCFVSDMNNLDWMRNTIGYLQSKYGKIDFIESNNEYWLRNDSILRQDFGVNTGYFPDELAIYQSKSKMKKYFQDAGVKTARYIIASTLENSLEFVNQVGYPIFAKPDSGVGASSTFKISNESDLRRFHESYLHETYIIEEFIEGEIVSFDGIANSKSEIVVAFKETFPTPIAEIVNNNLDVYYFAESKMPKAYRQMGERIIKSFNVKSRCFHCELFKLKKSKEGFAEKGEIVALEINLRSPGGNTTDLLNLVGKENYYDAYAKMITQDVSNLDNETNLIAYSINRKNQISYLHSDDEIKGKYWENLKSEGYYPPLFRDAMGDKFFFFVFEKDKKIEKDFLDFVLAKN